MILAVQFGGQKPRFKRNIADGTSRIENGCERIISSTWVGPTIETATSVRNAESIPEFLKPFFRILVFALGLEQGLWIHLP